LAGKSEPFHVLKCLVFQGGAHVGGAKCSKCANEKIKELRLFAKTLNGPKLQDEPLRARLEAIRLWYRQKPAIFSIYPDQLIGC